MVLNKTMKRIGAGCMAGLCAFSMLTTAAANAVPVEAAELENPAFPSADVLIAQTANTSSHITLLPLISYVI